MSLFLRKRKGFTMVELIVVIAIIGVLAAILIPVMVGYSAKSHVTSVNTTASDMQKQIDYFFTDADYKGYGMRMGQSMIVEPTISVVNGTWTLTITETPLSSFFNEKTLTWAGSGSGRRGDSTVGKNATELLAIKLADIFPEIQTAYISFRLEGGKCVALYYTPDTSSAITMQQFGIGGWIAPTYAWDNKTPGVNSQGYVVGTSPMLPIA